jgi:hypothetical protein
MRILCALLITLAVASVAYAGAGNHLVFAPAAVDLAAFCDGLTGFDHTNIVSGPGGGMVWLRGDGEPALAEGMADLGASYPEVWTDPERRGIYDTVLPPDLWGNPRPFAVFMGCEEEMGL